MAISTVSTKTSFYSDVNGSYALKVASSKMVVAAQWLKSKGCVFTNFNDRATGMTKFYIKSAPAEVVTALIRKHGFFNAKQAAPVTAPTRPTSKKQITREEWLARFGNQAVAPRPITTTAMKRVRSADELPTNADALKPIEVVVPQLAVEHNIYNKQVVNGMTVNGATYTCQTVQLEGDGFIPAVSLSSYQPQTNSELNEGFTHQTAVVANTEVAFMPGCATTEQLMGCTLNQLYRFATTHNIKGRNSLKGLKNKPALVEKLLGLVKKSELK